MKHLRKLNPKLQKMPRTKADAIKECKLADKAVAKVAKAKCAPLPRGGLEGVWF